MEMTLLLNVMLVLNNVFFLIPSTIFKFLACLSPYYNKFCCFFFSFFFTKNMIFINIKFKNNSKELCLIDNATIHNFER